MTTPFQYTVEMLVGSTWTDISNKNYQRDVCSIVRGRRSEGNSADPQTCSFTLNNRDGRFSPKNPTGPYYGLFGRNTQVRVSLPAATSYLQINAVDDAATIPDSVGLSITGDVDLRIDAWLPSWRVAQDLLGKYTATGNQRSYEMWVDSTGVIVFKWSTDGTSAGAITVSSTLPVPSPIFGRRAVRVTLDINNGASGNTVTFYTASTMSGTWVQLGDPVITAGTTAIYDSTALLYIGKIAARNGGVSGAALNSARIKVYSAQVLSGIAGTIKASPDFTAQTDGATSFVDAQGNTCTMNGTATIVGRDYRFYGEISELPKARDITNKDISVSATASGVLRRYNRGTVTSRSAYQRACVSTVSPITNLMSYWPCEDGTESTFIASGLSGGSPMQIISTVSLANDSSSFACSQALPVFTDGSLLGTVPGYTDTGQIQVRQLIAIPAAGLTNGTVLMRLLLTGGTASRWDLVYGTGGTLSLNAYTVAGSSLLATGAVAYGLNGTRVRIGLSLARSGSDVVYTFSTLSVGASTGGYTSATLSSQTIGTIIAVAVAPGGGASGMTIGHITVQNTIGSVFDLLGPFNAYSAGETAGSRIIRLAAEESITVTIIGDAADAPLMGPQFPGTFTDLIRECETTDGGMLYELRDTLGVGYRTVRALAAQSATATFNFTAGDLSPSFIPTEDDLTILNDVTASRAQGSSFHYVVDSGSLSTQSPPVGVGTYQGTIDVNPAYDTDLDDIAAWRAHIGTTDDARWPSVNIDLHRTNYTSNSTLSRSVTALDIGDRFTITNPPVDQPPDTITLLAQGYTETLTPFTRAISLNGIPESPYHIGLWDTGVSRYSSDGSTLTSDVSSGATSLSVSVATGILWGHADGNFDIMVGGERMTVTAVSGTTSPQTFTVTRSVNGVVKAQTAGTVIALFDPSYYVR